MAKIEINRRLYWIYANCRVGQNRSNRRRICIYFIYIDYQNENRTLLIIEVAKIEINRRPYWIYANYRDGQNRN